MHPKHVPERGRRRKRRTRGAVHREVNRKVHNDDREERAEEERVNAPRRHVDRDSRVQAGHGIRAGSSSTIL